jgi:hypothetical protein
MTRQITNSIEEDTTAIPTGVWLTLEHEPEEVYGMGLSAPLVFRTEELSSRHIHLRLGYYSKHDAAFYEAGTELKRPWKVHEVTHWCQLPLPPDPRRGT